MKNCCYNYMSCALLQEFTSPASENVATLPFEVTLNGTHQGVYCKSTTDAVIENLQLACDVYVQQIPLLF